MERTGGGPSAPGPGGASVTPGRQGPACPPTFQPGLTHRAGAVQACLTQTFVPQVTQPSVFLPFFLGSVSAWAGGG